MAVKLESEFIPCVNAFPGSAFVGANNIYLFSTIQPHDYDDFYTVPIFKILFSWYGIYLLIAISQYYGHSMYGHIFDSNIIILWAQYVWAYLGNINFNAAYYMSSICGILVNELQENPLWHASRQLEPTCILVLRSHFFPLTPDNVLINAL